MSDAFALCVWAEIPGKPGYYDCLHCGLPLGAPKGQRGPREYPARVRRECVKPEDRDKKKQARKTPSVAQRAKNYLSAREKWVAAGKPMRSAEERAALFAICQQCPSGEYREKLLRIVAPQGICDVCGCGLHPERDVANKLAWATEECPRGHWPKSDAAKRHGDPDDGRNA